MVSAVSNESHAVPSYRALGVVKDLGNPPDESAESESDGCGLGRKNFACRGLRLEPRGEDSAVLVQVGLSTRVDFASVSSRVGNLFHSIYLSRGFISAHCSVFVLTFPASVDCSLMVTPPLVKGIVHNNMDLPYSVGVLNFRIVSKNPDV